MKLKTRYVCQHCGAQYPKWSGQCSECSAWNSLVEELTIPTKRSSSLSGFTPLSDGEVKLLADVELSHEMRIPTGSQELDRILGGGLVMGSVILIGGDPGIGKSTLLLQTLCQLSQQQSALYITGEESLQQVTLRARRLALPEDKLHVLAETSMERIIAIVQKLQPKVMVIDSIQTMATDLLQSAPGAVGQVRECAAQWVRYAKNTHTAIFLVGHVTKEGSLAGPRVLEHMVDTVLYFEGERDNRFRIVRAVKNRFGAVNELGIFAMTDKGLKEVSNPSAIFLSRYDQPVAGSTLLATWEGSRAMLVEIQALVDTSHLGNPRRVTVGLEPNRLAMLLAVLHRHGGIATYDQDIFINVVGGVRITETGADLALLLAVISSLKNRPLPADLIVFGEVGLAGEIRPVQSGLERLRAAAKHGFKQAIAPQANVPKDGISGIKIHAVQRLEDALSLL